VHAREREAGAPAPLSRRVSKFEYKLEIAVCQPSPWAPAQPLLRCARNAARLTKRAPNNISLPLGCARSAARLPLGCARSAARFAPKRAPGSSAACPEPKRP